VEFCEIIHSDFGVYVRESVPGHGFIVKPAEHNREMVRGIAGITKIIKWNDGIDIPYVTNNLT
jgi:hypothetical protein